MAIFLVRHGETAANAARVFQHPDVALSERGLAQARRLARRLAGEGVAQVLSSDYARAAATAEAIAATCNAPLSIEPLLRERHFGALRGTPYADLDFDPFAPDYAPPGGESWPVFHARVERAWERVSTLAADTPGNLAVVTHGLVCHVLARRHLAIGELPLEITGFGNTALTVIEPEPPWRTTLLACTAHLGE